MCAILCPVHAEILRVRTCVQSFVQYTLRSLGMKMIVLVGKFLFLRRVAAGVASGVRLIVVPSLCSLHHAAVQIRWITFYAVTFQLLRFKTLSLVLSRAVESVHKNSDFDSSIFKTSHSDSSIFKTPTQLRVLHKSSVCVNDVKPIRHFITTTWIIRLLFRLTTYI
jgi:hypothetical protein